MCTVLTAWVVHFNSSVVRLRAKKKKASGIKKQYFNSSVVRLREERAIKAYAQGSAFQFQCGAIEGLGVSNQAS